MCNILNKMSNYSIFRNEKLCRLAPDFLPKNLTISRKTKRLEELAAQSIDLQLTAEADSRELETMVCDQSSSEEEGSLLSSEEEESCPSSSSDEESWDSSSDEEPPPSAPSGGESSDTSEDEWTQQRKLNSCSGNHEFKLNQPK